MMAFSLPDHRTSSTAFYVFFGIFLTCVGTLIIWRPPALTWHDSQRLAQILIFSIFILAIFLGQNSFRHICPVDHNVGRAVAALILLGFLSALNAEQPRWAFVEIALITSCLGIAWGTASIRRVSGERLDWLLIGAVTLLSLIKTIEFATLYAASLAADTPDINAYKLLSGFNNPRFYGQFQSLTLPLLALPLVVKGHLSRYAIPAFILLTLWWTIAIASGTRGTWLGLFVAMLGLILTGRAGRTWGAWQASTALLGLLCFWITLTLIPDWLGISVQNHAGTRMNTSLSAREVIWLQAWEMIREHPLLGHGPMHFSNIPNKVAANPHQAALQWAAEWGVPSLLCVTWLIACAAKATFKLLRKHSFSLAQIDMLRVCLTGSILASLTQAMVDGVIVMPYTQIWLAILAGWLLALHPQDKESPSINHGLRKAWLYTCVTSVAFLVTICQQDLPRLNAQQSLYIQRMGGPLHPRFWSQGVIADGFWQENAPDSGRQNSRPVLEKLSLNNAEEPPSSFLPPSGPSG